LFATICRVGAQEAFTDASAAADAQRQISQSRKRVADLCTSQNSKAQNAPVWVEADPAS
jgi:hypothetical protein